MASNTITNYEQLSYSSPSGSMWRGQARQIISDGVATRTLLASEAGAWCAFDLAAGVAYTLPTPVAGMTFTFFTTVTRTSNAHKFTTKTTASEFLLGGVAQLNSAAATGEFFAANGTSITTCSMNGTTTGGIIGDRITITAISSTVWFVDGVCNQTGTAATPFA